MIDWQIHSNGFPLDYSLPASRTDGERCFTDPDHLTRALRRGLPHIQLRLNLINGCLVGARLSLIPPTPP